MRLEKKRNYGKVNFGISDISGEKLIDPRLHQRVELCLQLAALRGIGEDLGGDAMALRRVGDQFMNDVVGVNRLDAEFVQITSEKRFPAGNAACKGNLHDKGKPKFGS